MKASLPDQTVITGPGRIADMISYDECLLHPCLSNESLTLPLGWCDHESGKIFKNPPILQRSINDPQKLPGQGDDCLPRTSCCFDAGIVVREIRAVAPGT